jgi:hypothetical protein
MMGSVTHEWLWSDDHTKITQWFLAQPRLTYKEFYASFLNFANRAWELSRQKERAPPEGLEKFIVELLQMERIPAEELLTALQEYSAGLGEGKARYKQNGLVAFSRGLSKLSTPAWLPMLCCSASTYPSGFDQSHLTLSHKDSTLLYVIEMHDLVKSLGLSTEICSCDISQWALTILSTILCISIPTTTCRTVTWGSTQCFSLEHLTDTYVDHQTLTAGKNKLQARVQGDLRKARNSLRVANLQAAAAAKKATMATQQPLPAFVAPSSLPAYVAPSPLPGWLAPSASPVPAPSLRSTELAWDPFVQGRKHLSLQSVEEVMDNLGSAAAPEKQAQKATTLSVPVKFGSLPLAVDKKVKKDEEEEEMIDVGEEEVEVDDEDMVL